MTAKEYTQSATLWADDAMRLAIRTGGSRADAEDAVQEALAALWQHRDEVEATRGKGYLMGATYRQMMMLFRRRQQDRNFRETLQPDNNQRPDESFDTREAINLALQQLNPQQRAILELRDVQGYSYNEIAETLSLTTDQVQVYLFRARVSMRKQLKLMGYESNQ